MITVTDRRGVLQSETGYVLDLQYLNVDEEKLNQYLRKFPMPPDPAYTEDDLRKDLNRCMGSYLLPEDISEAATTYIGDLLNSLMEE